MPAAARLTDLHTCPMQTPGLPPIPHVGGPVIGPGVPTVLIVGKGVADGVVELWDRRTNERTQVAIADAAAAVREAVAG